MKTVELGNTGKRVSALAPGCMNFGSRTDAARSTELLDQYLEAGGTFLDTANNYAFWHDGFEGGESERFLGRYLERRGNRDDIFLASKVGANPTVKGGGFDTAEGLSGAAIEKAIDESLERLRTDHLDLYYAHVDHRESDLMETLETFDKLVESGKVRHIACSNMKTWRIEQARNISHANGWAKYCGVQQRFSYLRPVPGADFDVQEAVTEELLDYCTVNDDFTLLAYSPLLNGAYTREDREVPDEYQSPDADARLTALKQVAAGLEATPNQVVLAWMMQGTPTVIPLVAASTEAQLAESLGATQVTLSSEQMTFLNEAGNLNE